MTRQRGLALFAAILAVTGVVCAVILVGLSPGKNLAKTVADGMLGRGADSSPSVPVNGRNGDDTASGAGPGAESGTGDASGAGSGTGSGTGHRVPHQAAPAASGDWATTWAAGAVGAEPGLPQGLPDRTVRNVVHTSIGGTGARITLTNLYGTAPLYVSHASIALSEGGGPRAVPGSMRRLTFGGGRSPSVTVPSGRQLVSDPVALPVPADSDLLLTLYTPRPGGTVTYHAYAQQTSYVAPGDRTEDMSGSTYTRQTPYWRYVTAVDVKNHEAAGTIVAFGDSITDGIGSGINRNHRWPDFLSDRVRDSGNRRYGVIDEGIGGNQVLRDASLMGEGRSGIDRFAQDALSHPGVRAVFIDLGVNDILHGHERSGAPIVAGLKELTRQAHAHGVRVVGSTLTPFGSHTGYNATKERVRDEVNTAIHDGGVFDAVVDFDRVLRDPSAPGRLRPAYDSGDGLHPSAGGYRAMASAVNLRTLLGTGARAGTPVGT